MKPTKVDGSGTNLEICSGNFPSCAKLENTGHPDSAAIGKNQADIIDQHIVTLK